MTGGATALHCAVSGSHLNCVKQMIEHSIVNAIDINQDTALHVAVRKAFTTFVRVLLTSSLIDTSLKNANGKTPMDIAKENKFRRIRNILANHEREIAINALDLPSFEIPVKKDIYCETDVDTDYEIDTPHAGTDFEYLTT